MAPEAYDVAWALEKGYTPEEISAYVRSNGLIADSSGVAEWRMKQRNAAMQSGAAAQAAAPQTAGGSAPAEATNQRTPFKVPQEAGSWSDPLPSVLGTAGMLIPNPLIGVPVSAALQSAGAWANQGIRRAQGLPAPSGKAAREAILREGLMGGGAAATGHLAGSVVGLAGKGLNTRAFSDPLAAETSLSTRGVVGKPWGPWRSAAQIADEGTTATGAEMQRLIDAGEQMGVTVKPSGFQQVLEARVKAAEANKVSNPAAYNYWKRRLMAWKGAHNAQVALGPSGPVQIAPAKELTLSEVQTMKKLNAEEAKRIYEARQTAGASPKESLDEQYAKDLADWARRELETALPGQGGRGIKALNQEYEDYRRMGSSERAVSRPKPGRVPSDAAPAHTRVYGHSVSLLPSLPPDVASRAAMALTSAPTKFGIKALPWAYDFGTSTGLARNYQPPPDPTQQSDLSPEMQALLRGQR